MNFPKIGMRNIKTTLSVFLCLLLFETISRENSIYACVAAVICLQNTIVDSLAKGVSRIMGTIVGGMVGIFVLFLVSEIFVVREDMMIYIIPLGIILLIEICVAIDQKQAVVISCVVYLSILISKNRDGGYIVYTINRVLDTSIGILIAILVNKYVDMPAVLKRYFKTAKCSDEEDSNSKESDMKIIEENSQNDRNSQKGSLKIAQGEAENNGTEKNEKI